MTRTLTSSFAALALAVLAISPAQAANPCNPCSMKAHVNPCSPNPCSMKKANPCDAGGHEWKAGTDEGMNGDRMVDANGRTMIRSHAFDSYKEAVDVGRKMWNDQSLGTSEVSCLSCHGGYERLNLEKRQNFPHYVAMVGDVVTLDQMINYCMINPMQGKPFEADSKELTAMAAYYRAYRMQYLREQKR